MSEPSPHARHVSREAFEETISRFQVSSGESLMEASNNQPLALVFLRHFGCTFTRQILRGLEELKQTADQRGARLVLVHMLQSGAENRYLHSSSDIARVADPRCDLYRAFGLGKGGPLELIGPRVLWLGLVSLYKGCGVGHLAGDGRQMPGAFVLHHGKVLSAQPAKSASDLPNLAALFSHQPSA